MLRRLSIENYYLIERAELHFDRGATMFTGETGSGKTMVLGALDFVLGGRSAADAVGRRADRACVTLEFDPPAALRARLSADGYPIDDDEYATIERELTDAGKSSVRLNGRSATAAYLREIGSSLAETVGQHEAQRLLAPAFHLELLDAFAGNEALELRSRVRDLHAALQEALHALASLESDERRAEEQFAYARFARDEIRAASLQAGEDEQLAARRRLLENAGKIAGALAAAHEALTGEDGAAADALGGARAAIDPIASIDARYAEMTQQLAALQSEVNDLAAVLTRESESLEFDRGELDSINARLEAIDDLKRKHGGTFESVLASEQDFSQIIDAYEHKDERRREMRAHIDRLRSSLTDAAKQLTAARRTAGDRLKRAVEAELCDLAFASAKFAVQIVPLSEPSATGADALEFVFAANKGEELRRIGKAASGGELSRVLLALVVALAAARGRAALIFDEIDAGIGGATATAVGIRLGRLAQDAQVVCVTHLAQIASWAGTHYVLEKSESRAGTTIRVREIDKNSERAAEIARMLSGETHAAALEHARLLLASANAPA